MVSYPKPLSEKSIAALYREAGLSESVQNFLHDLFAACANLYGQLPVRDVWEIYKELDIPSPKILRKDLVAFSAIARREVHPYRVYEVEELFEDEPHKDLDRHIVSNSLVTVGYNRFFRFYAVINKSHDKPYWLPDNLLDWRDPMPSKEETDLLNFLGELQVTADEYHPKFGEPSPNEHKGQKLKEFSYLTRMEQVELKITKRPEAQKKMLDELSGSESEKIMWLYSLRDHIGIILPNENLETMVEELTEVGVELDEKQFGELVRLTTEFHNNHHLWCNSGWTPKDLACKMKISRQGKPAVSFGPGLEKAFADGSLDRDEIISALRERGIDVID